MKKHKAWGLWIIGFGVLVVIGIFRKEITEVILNATTLCLSCIGIGQ